MKEPAPCGTLAAYRAHIARKERPCAACRAFNAALSRERRKIEGICMDCRERKPIFCRGRCSPCYRKAPKRRQPGKEVPWPEEWVQPCGTVAAYRRHVNRGEKVCDPCREASLEHSRTRRRVVGVCVECGESKKIEARGMCNSCYHKAPKRPRRKKKR